LCSDDLLAASFTAQRQLENWFAKRKSTGLKTGRYSCKIDGGRDKRSRNTGWLRE